jgi:hypothetical protein
MSREFFFGEGLYADAILPDGDILFAGTGRIMPELKFSLLLACFS